MNIHIMVLYIYQRHIKEVTVKNDKDPLDSIVPLVLPTQLDSEDSDSKNEENGKGGEDINEDLETKQYDEDIDEHLTVPSMKKEQTYRRDKESGPEENVKVHNCEIVCGTETICF